MSKITPTQRTLKYYRDLGLTTIQKVERWQSFGITGQIGVRKDFGKSPGHRVDLFGCIDIIAVGMLDPDESEQIIGIQCCGQTGHAEHVAKIIAEPRAMDWIRAGGKLILVSWSKRKKKRRETWCPRIQEITIDDFKDPF